MLNIKHLIIATAGTTLISVGLSSNPSLAVNIKTWNLKFFDYKNELVGTGEFSYDLDTTTFIQTTYPEDGSPGKGFYVKTALEDFSATITLEDAEGEGFFTELTKTLNEYWRDFYSINLWWYDPSAPVPFGHSWIIDPFDPAFGVVVDDDEWWLGPKDAVDEVLRMDSAQPLSYTVWRGNWYASLTTNLPYGNYGTWIATIPEPLTLLGTGTAIGFGLLFKKRVSK